MVARKRMAASLNWNGRKISESGSQTSALLSYSESRRSANNWASQRRPSSALMVSSLAFLPGNSHSSIGGAASERVDLAAVSAPGWASKVVLEAVQRLEDLVEEVVDAVDQFLVGAE